MQNCRLHNIYEIIQQFVNRKIHMHLLLDFMPCGYILASVLATLSMPMMKVEVRHAFEAYWTIC